MGSVSPADEVLIEQAALALAAARRGDDDGAMLHASTNIQDVVMLLFGECSAMVAALGDGGATPVKVQVFDSDGTEVSIDQADPPVRTAVRTLLAEVHGNSDDAREQVEIALRGAAPEEVASLVLQALRWTIRLAGECLDRELPVAGWVSDAMGQD
ncbi:MAG: hypothetical protein ACRDQB_02530 [Thermocrispum sp.]